MDQMTANLNQPECPACGSPARVEMRVHTFSETEGRRGRHMVAEVPHIVCPICNHEEPAIPIEKVKAEVDRRIEQAEAAEHEAKRSFMRWLNNQVFWCAMGGVWLGMGFEGLLVATLRAPRVGDRTFSIVMACFQMTIGAFSIWMNLRLVKRGVGRRIGLAEKKKEG